MATAKRLPSGSWRCQVFSHFEDVKQPDGTIKKKRIYKSFTCDDPSPRGKRKVELEAANFAAEQERNRRSGMTVKQAIDQYIKYKLPVLSPSTVVGYRSLQRNDFDRINSIPLDHLRSDIVQGWISELSEKLSPKTVRNAHGLFVGALGMFAPGLSFNTQLPAKEEPDLYTPVNDDVKRLLDHVRGKDLEICICLAAMGPMRRGEICALESSDIHGNTITVRRSMVLGPDKQWHIKQPKTYAGYREITYPPEVIKLMEGRTGRLFDFTPDILSARFRRAVKFAHVPHFRFHDLRHYSASIQHAMGIPDEYIMQRGGWASDYVMKRVYRHAMADQEQAMTSKVNDYFGQFQKARKNG